MPNVRISDAADAGTLVASDMLPLARSGNTNAYHATMTEIANFTNASLASGAYGNVGRNLLHNPLFNVAQRGGGPFTVNNTYAADRWSIGFTGGTLSVSVVTQGDAGRTQIGDEASANILSVVFTGTAGAGDYTEVPQPIENVRRLAGKTVTVSFWALASSAGLKVGISLDQIFGSGGSPSAPVLVNGTAITLATTWARYSASFTLPTAIGKVTGTNGDDHTQLNLWCSSGANNASRAGNIGVQSGTIQLWGVQLEVGSVATPLEKPDPRYDLANCQRFYHVGTVSLNGYHVAGNAMAMTYSFSVTMRAIPTIAWGVLGSSNVGAPSTAYGDRDMVALQAVVSATGAGWINATFNASADL